MLPRLFHDHHVKMPNTQPSQLNTIDQLLNWAHQQFAASDLYYGHGTDNAWDEAVQLVLFVMELPIDCDKSVKNLPTSALQQQRLQSIVEQRIKSRKPLAYLINQCWFMGLPFYVDERVIVPRSPFAEWIGQQCRPWVLPDQIHRICDLCTGSACIAIAAAHVFEHATVDAIDIDSDALAVATQNVTNHGLSDRINLILSDGFEAVPTRQYDLILSNPPYVPDAEMATLPQEYLQEPKIALRADHDGLAIVIRLLAQASNYLTPHGILMMEVGNSDEALQNTFPSVDFTWLEQSQGGHGLFVLSYDQLVQHQSKFKACIDGW